jgi:hypothetical protein
LVEKLEVRREEVAMADSVLFRDRRSEFCTFLKPEAVRIMLV